jgi:MFS family permease
METLTSNSYLNKIFVCSVKTRGGRGNPFLRKSSTAGSVLSALGDSSLSLSIASALQGFGGSFIMPLSLTLIYSVFSVENRSAAICQCESGRKGA